MHIVNYLAIIAIKAQSTELFSKLLNLRAANPPIVYIQFQNLAPILQNVALFFSSTYTEHHTNQLHSSSTKWKQSKT